MNVCEAISICALWHVVPNRESISIQACEQENLGKARSIVELHRSKNRLCRRLGHGLSKLELQLFLFHRSVPQEWHPGLCLVRIASSQ